MNLEHLRTVIWLRGRLRINQLKRGGAANFVILVILTALAVLLAIGLFIGGWVLGATQLADVQPVVLLLIWDGLVAAFLFFWMIGLMTELQRSEVLSLDRFLHLPVTPNGVFLINYLSSLVRLSVIVFAPAMIGLSIGLVSARGAAMLWLFPLMAAFFLMVTALTYQFQGWLASLMANPRRRRTIIVMTTLVFVLLVQIPNLINLWMPRTNTELARATESFSRLQELNGQLQSGKITMDDYQKRVADLQKEIKATAERESRQELETAGQIAQLVSAVLPPGWLAIGAMAAGEGKLLLPLAGTLGLTLIGFVSLWRAYRTTMRLYTGHYTASPIRRAAAAPAVRDPTKPTFLERPIPGLSEHAAVVALATFRSILRAPETKMLLLSPVFMVIVFGSMLLRPTDGDSPGLRALLPFAAMAMTLLGMVQLVGNQFGFDRTGFRVFVLSPVSRRDILLGKNLAIMPLVFGIGGIMTALIQIVRPLRVDHLLAAIPQAVSMFLIFCLMANWLSIYSPLPIAAGSLKPKSPQFTIILLHLAFVLTFPLAMAPTLLPLAVEQLLPLPDWARGLPWTLILSLVLCPLIVLVYRVVLTTQGELLQSREQAILQIVTTKAE